MRRLRWMVALCALTLSACAVTYSAPGVPPPLAERVPAPPAANVPLIWEPGHYNWDGRRYTWSAGRWINRAGHGTLWQDGYWRREGRRYVWIPGHWL